MVVEKPVVESELKELGYPSFERMIELVNTDLLVFMERYQPTGIVLSEDEEVEAILFEVDKTFVFLRKDGKQLGVWKNYFLDPELWKTERLKKWSGLSY